MVYEFKINKLKFNKLSVKSLYFFTNLFLR